MPAEPTNNLLDARTLLAACGGDPTLLRKMIDSFSVNAPRHLERIGRAIECGDAAELRKAAHKMSGFVSTFSTAAAEVAGALEYPGIDTQTDRTNLHYRRLGEMLAALGASLAHLGMQDLQRHADS